MIWVLAIAVFIGAFIISVAPTGRLGYEDRHLPDEETRGVSIFPTVILIPRCGVGAAWVADRLAGDVMVLLVFVAYAFLVLDALGELIYWARKDD